jgi:hypothetical protein
MKRTAVVLGLIACVAAPAAAQWLGMPAWSSPKGGTGVGIYADYGRPDEAGQKGKAFAGRASLGLGTVTLTAGASSWEPENFGKRVLSYGGTVAFRLIGGSLLPLAVNLQLGVGHNREARSGPDTLSETTSALAAVGLSVPLPTPGISIEPYVSPGVRYHKFWSAPTGGRQDETNVGWVVGANLGFGPVGIHLARDSEKFSDGTTHGVFGVGVHMILKVPLGM